jgi:hypothetical protein
LEGSTWFRLAKDQLHNDGTLPAERLHALQQNFLYLNVS